MQRVLILESWRELEKQRGDAESLEEVDKLLPERTRRRRAVPDSDAFEEYYEYVFPEDRTTQPDLKILEAAKLWKKQRGE